MKDPLSDLHPSRAVARRMYELETELQRARMHLRRHSKSPDTLGRWGLELPSAPQQEEGWFLTYLDMMTLLLVVMIVMLGFSGTLGKQPGDTLSKSEQAAEVSVVAMADETPAESSSTPDLARAAEQAVEAPASAAAVEVGQLDSTTESETQPQAATSDTGIDVAAKTATGPGTGLLPGGTGLLPGHASIPDALAPADMQSGPSTLVAGALPSDATIVPALTADDTPTLADMYPGWGADDLAASFVGPPRPAHLALSPAPQDDTDTIILPPAPAPAEDIPSEGEALAAGLPLGELGSDVEVVVSERSVSFRVNSEILFDSSQADLSRSGLAVLRRIVGVLTEAGHNVTVEGHTDSVPVRRNVRYPSNWELSSARAGSVVRYMQANGIAKHRLKAIGYADTRPIADNDTAEGRARNRRVELVIEQGQ